jgi:hypothetical protein
MDNFAPGQGLRAGYQAGNLFPAAIADDKINARNVNQSFGIPLSTASGDYDPRLGIFPVELA